MNFPKRVECRRPVGLAASLLAYPHLNAAAMSLAVLVREGGETIAASNNEVKQMDFDA
jgi:hypothetical protein